MTKRLELMHYILEKHRDTYQQHVGETLLAMEATSVARLHGWEQEICHSQECGNPLNAAAKAFLQSPSYGDGGMAAAVHIVSAKKKRAPKA